MKTFRDIALAGISSSGLTHVVLFEALERIQRAGFDLLSNLNRPRYTNQFQLLLKLFLNIIFVLFAIKAI